MIGDIFGIGELICKLLILMVAGIFKLVSGAYQIFLVLAKTNIFEQDTYAHLTDKVYIILAVTMLFVVAYTFITLIIDPDKNKGGKAVEDLIKKSVTSLILIVLCPTLFTLAFDLQDAIMDQDIIGKFFTSETSGEEEVKKSVKQGGNLMAGTTFAAFFYPTFESTTTYELKNQSEGKHLKKDEYEIDCSKAGSCTLQEAIDYASATGTFSVFTAFAKNWLDGEQQKTSVDFNMLLALIAGFYLLWVIISFCFDLAIRVIKLAFYQVIAPICIACRMLPDKDSIFKNWWKAVCKTYLSIFIRVFIMNLAVFLMVELTKSNFWSNICNSEEMECGGVIKFLAFAFLVLGLVTFIKQASKLIDEIFGLGDVKLGISEKFKEATKDASAIGAGAAAVVASKGNPFAFKRGYKGGWKTIGKEQQRHEEYADALRNGATRGQILGDTVRRGFGFRTLAEQQAREAERRDREVENHFTTPAKDANGNVITDANGREVPIAITDAEGNAIAGAQLTMNDDGTIHLDMEAMHRLDDQLKINQANISMAQAEIKEIDKLISTDNQAIGFKKALKGESEKRIAEGKVTTTYRVDDGHGHVKDYSNVTLQDILDIRQHMTADQLAHSESENVVRDRMIDEDVAAQLSASGNNASKNAVENTWNTIRDEGGYSYQQNIKDEHGRNRSFDDGHGHMIDLVEEGKFEVTYDANKNRIVTQTIERNDGTRTVQTFTEHVDAVTGKVSYTQHTVNTDAHGTTTAVPDVEKTELQVQDVLDKCAKGSSQYHGQQKNNIQKTKVDYNADQIERIKSVQQQAKEQVEGEKAEPENRGARSSSSYTGGGKGNTN